MVFLPSSFTLKSNALPFMVILDDDDDDDDEFHRVMRVIRPFIEIEISKKPNNSSEKFRRGGLDERNKLNYHCSHSNSNYWLLECIAGVRGYSSDDFVWFFLAGRGSSF